MNLPFTPPPPAPPPPGIITAMELQAEAERRKRASILESEGQRQAVINVAEGSKQEVRGTAAAAAAAGRAAARTSQQLSALSLLSYLLWVSFQQVGGGVVWSSHQPHSSVCVTPYVALCKA